MAMEELERARVLRAFKHLREQAKTYEHGEIKAWSPHTGWITIPPSPGWDAGEDDSPPAA